MQWSCSVVECVCTSIVESVSLTQDVIHFKGFDDVELKLFDQSGAILGMGSVVHFESDVSDTDHDTQIIIQEDLSNKSNCFISPFRKRI